MESGSVGYRGLLDPELLVGIVMWVDATRVGVAFRSESASSLHYHGQRYGRGEVGEFVVIEGETNVLLGRVLEVRLPEGEGASIRFARDEGGSVGVVGVVQLLGSASLDVLAVEAGVDTYPSIGDRVYAAPQKFLSDVPSLMGKGRESTDEVRVTIGRVGVRAEGRVSVRPEALFGRHCAILGATGGGKSWTVARLMEECMVFSSKVILLDATGEYRTLSGPQVEHCHLGTPVEVADESNAVSVPPSNFVESDFIAMFEPAGKTQAPKLREAIRSLRLAKMRPSLVTDGIIKKINQPKQEFVAALNDGAIAASMSDPRAPFEVRHLPAQLYEECVFPTPANGNSRRWGGPTNEFAYCISLVTRIEGILVSPAFDCVFREVDTTLTDQIDRFLNGSQNVLRVCMSGIAQEYRAREVVANVVGRHMLSLARNGRFKDKPIIVMVDEAHNFLGEQLGMEDFVAKLDAFELIAKEGRKYGLCLCLATQRPRDLTVGVLSQMGTLIVHRLTNDRDREMVERACGEIDRSAAAFLPNLKQGEAIVVGVDFPIPLTVRVDPPEARPQSDGPDFGREWVRRDK